MTGHEGSKYPLICIHQRKADQDLPTHTDDPCTRQEGIKNTRLFQGGRNTFSSFNKG